MTLNASGKLSLGGATQGESVDLEISLSSNSSNSMVSADNKILTGKSTGPWVFPVDWRGKHWYNEVITDSVSGSTNINNLFNLTITGGRPSTTFTMSYTNSSGTPLQFTGTLDSSGNYTTIGYLYTAPGNYVFSFNFTGSRNSRSHTIAILNPPLVLSWNPTSISDSIYSGPYNSYKTSVLTATTNSAPTQTVTIQETSRPSAWSTSINYITGNPPSTTVSMGSGSTSTVTFGVFPPQGTAAGVYTGSFAAVYNNSANTLSIPWSITITVSEQVYSAGATYNATAGTYVAPPNTSITIYISNGVAYDTVTYTGAQTINLDSQGKYTLANVNTAGTGLYNYYFNFAATGHQRSISYFIYNELITVNGVGLLSNGSTVTINTTDTLTIAITGGIPNSGYSFSRTGTSSTSGTGTLDSSGSYTYTNQSLPQAGTYNYTINFNGTGGSGATRTFTIVSRLNTIDLQCYVIGGGAAGGSSPGANDEGAGGGGAGALLVGNLLSTTIGSTGSTPVYVLVGAGGPASPGQDQGGSKTGNGGASYVYRYSDQKFIYADGGGGGAAAGNGDAGGCGGGGSGAGSPGYGGTGGGTNFGLTELGSNGGDSDHYGGGGGGGGTSGVGGHGIRSGRSAANVGGTGGSGTSYTVTTTIGTLTFNLGGGGGGGGSTNPGAGGNENAGAGGGNSGSFNGLVGNNTNSYAGGSGTSSTGCGGGGSSAGAYYGSYSGGNGGSGIVVIIYTASAPLFSGGAVYTGAGSNAGSIFHVYTNSYYLTAL